jgi:hypothetical protein
LTTKKEATTQEKLTAYLKSLEAAKNNKKLDKSPDKRSEGSFRGRSPG